MSEAEGREAEKRNDDETRSHYYIHTRARWGEASPSFLRSAGTILSLSLSRRRVVLSRERVEAV